MKNHLPMARPLGARGDQKRSHLVGSHKMRDALNVETRDEGPTAIAIDIDPRVVALYAQPLSFRLDLQQVFETKKEARQAHPCVKAGSKGPQGLECVYTPDFLVELTNPVPLIVESKSDKEIEKRQADMERRKKVLSKLGYRFLVIPNSTFDPKGFHQNLVDTRDALRSLANRDCSVVIEIAGKVVNRFSAPFALGEVWSEIQPISDIHIAVAGGLVGYDLRAGKLSRDTKMWPAHGELAHLQILPLEN